MPIQYETVSYQNFGTCLKITGEAAELLVTLDVGPRIISYRLQGMENVFFEDIGRQVSNSGAVYDTHYKKGAVWYLYGGHRLWVAPELAPNTYFPDNEPVEYRVGENGVTFFQRPQTENGVACRLHVSLDEATSHVRLCHEVQNIGSQPRTLSPWPITVMAPGGVEILKLPTEQTGLLPNRMLAFWPYSSLTDSRLQLGEQYIVLRQDEAADGAFKMGLNNTCGSAAYLVRGCLFVMEHPHNPEGRYPDFGASFETYTSPLILEMETLGELAELQPGETALHEESFRLFPTKLTPEEVDEKTLASLAMFFGL